MDTVKEFHKSWNQERVEALEEAAKTLVREFPWGELSDMFTKIGAKLPMGEPTIDNLKTIMNELKKAIAEKVADGNIDTITADHCSLYLSFHPCSATLKFSFVPLSIKITN